LPLIPNFSDSPPFNEAAIQKGEEASPPMLHTLEDKLSLRVYLVGESITLADIMVAIYVSRGLQGCWMQNGGGNT
jgi:elongation factor 1-gamma